MQNIIIEKPYQFVAPYRATFWSWLFKLLKIPEWRLRKAEGVVDYEVRNIERLTASIAAGHGILITPNHPRTADPVATAEFMLLHVRQGAAPGAAEFPDDIAAAIGRLRAATAALPGVGPGSRRLELRGR